MTSSLVAVAVEVDAGEPVLPSILPAPPTGHPPSVDELAEEEAAEDETLPGAPTPIPKPIPNPRDCCICCKSFRP